MGYKIKTGQREMGGIRVSCSCSWPVHWAHIFCDCKECAQSIGLKFEDDGYQTANQQSDAFSDTKFFNIIKWKGWKLLDFKNGKPMSFLCPSCQKVKELSQSA